MTGRAGRRPPRLEPILPELPERRGAREPSTRHRLVRARVAGRVPGLAAGEVVARARRLVAGDRRALLGLDRFPRLTTDAVLDAVSEVWGWSRHDARADVAIDPDRTLAGLVAAVARLREVAAGGGRVAFATCRPASLLVVHRALATLAADAGADVLGGVQSGPFRDGGAPGRRLWWLDGVALVTDGVALVAAQDATAFDELRFELGRRPDLVVADGVFAGAAARAGLDVIALAGVGSVALGVAASRGMLAIVPLDETRPPAAYEPVVDVATRVLASPALHAGEHVQQ